MKNRLKIIYQPSGRAKEYAIRAANLYTGCSHGCLYCFGPSIPPMKKKEVFHFNIQTKDRVIERLQEDVKVLISQGDNQEILLSFVTDPYQPLEMELGITRQAITILIEQGLTFTVLTKGGTRAVRDFDLLEGYPKARFGTSLVFTKQTDASIWEPNASSIQDRINAIQEAYRRGIKTWVSLEPVIYPDQALELIKELHPLVDHWKIGKLNHRKPPQPVDWIQFRLEAQELLESLGADFYFKNSLPYFDYKAPKISINIQTSYFARAKQVENPVSIARKTPFWSNVKSYPKLAPSIELVRQYKDGNLSPADYEKRYYDEILNHLNPREIVKELTDLFGPNVTLLCYERAGEFCHRTLVADWIEKGTGIHVPEMKIPTA